MRVCLALLVVSLCASWSFADTMPTVDPPDAGVIELWIQPDGMAQLVNVTDEPAWFDGYEIRSTGELLAPSAWLGIEGVVEGGHETYVLQELGSGGLTFEKAGQPSVHTRCMAELNLEGWGVIQGGKRFNLGRIAPHALTDEMTFRYCYVLPGVGGQVYDGEWVASAVVIPEPATITLMTLCALPLLRRKGNAHR